MRCHATTEMMQRHSAPPVVASLDIATLDIARLDVASLAVASLAVASLAVASLGIVSLGVASLSVASLDVAIAGLDVASLDHANLGEEEGIGLGLGAISASCATAFSCRAFIWTGIWTGIWIGFWAGEAPIGTVGGTKFSTTPIASVRLCKCDTTPALLRKRALTSARWREFRSGTESWRKLRNVQSR